MQTANLKLNFNSKLQTKTNMQTTNLKLKFLLQTENLKLELMCKL